jgi:hypothetical protein
MPKSIDNYLEESTAVVIHTDRDLRIVQLTNLRLVEIRIIAPNNFIAKEITRGEKGEEKWGLSIEKLAHHLEEILGNPFFKPWSIEDIQSIKPELTEAQARAALKLAIETHNAEIGINWEVLAQCADRV